MGRTPAVKSKAWTQWENFRKMQKLVATGSYRPPEWCLPPGSREGGCCLSAARNTFPNGCQRCRLAPVAPKCGLVQTLHPGLCSFCQVSPLIAVASPNCGSPRCCTANTHRHTHIHPPTYPPTPTGTQGKAALALTLPYNRHANQHDGQYLGTRGLQGPPPKTHMGPAANKATKSCTWLWYNISCHQHPTVTTVKGAAHWQMWSNSLQHRRSRRWLALRQVLCPTPA